MMNDAFSGSDPLSRFSGCGQTIGNRARTTCGRKMNRFQRPGFSGEGSQCGNGMWCHRISLSHLPTKPENLHVKMENETRTLSVSGKSEVTTDAKSGMKIFSVHNWQKEIAVPENLNVETLACKMELDFVILTAEFKKEEIAKEDSNATEIPIEKLD